METKEEWRPIIVKRKFVNAYVSNLGRVRYSIDEGPDIPYRYNKKGYRVIYLRLVGPVFIHRLVAKAFIPNPKRRKQVNHIDGNKENNTANNLEWVTNRQNGQHELENNLCHSKLTKEQVIEIADLLMGGKYSNHEIATRFDVSESLIGCIQNKKIWKRVIKDYAFPKRKHVNKNTIRKMCRLLSQGYTAIEVAEMCGSYREYVERIHKGYIHKSITCDEFGFGKRID